MPPVELTTNAGENAGNQPTTIVPVPAAFVPPSVKAKIGIIYPPPEVRNIVDKTASFVARNGPSFESKVKEAESNNAKFNFLNPHDPYHAYYLHKVKEFMEGKAAMPGTAEQQQQQQTLALTPSMQTNANKVQTKAQSDISKFLEPIIIKDPPSEYEFMIEPPSISAYELDIVKLTAQFVARNGRQFLTSLMSKEARNPQFDFLKPAHGLFNYFTKLVEQYTKILIPSKELLTKLSVDIDNQQKIMDEVNYRVEWVKHQLRERAKEEEAVEKERAAYSQIDWHEFVVVETVDYQPQEQGNFPPPTTPEMVGARMLLQERLDRNNFQHITSTTMVSMSDLSAEMDMGSPPHSPPSAMMSTVNMQEMDMEQDDDDMNVPPPPQAPQPPFIHRGAPPPPVMISRIPANQPPLPPGLPTNTLPPAIPTDKLPTPLKPQDVIIKSYNPKEKMLTIHQGEQYLISPITKEKILANSISSHTKYALLDPAWIQRREKEVAEQQEKEQVYEPGSHVELELKKFAERRTDIFGMGSQETIIGRKIGEEERRPDDKVQWDGHTATAEKTSKKALANITIEEQINAIHRSQGLIDDDSSAANRIGPSIPKPTTTSTYSSTAKTIQKPPQLSTLVTKPMAPMNAPPQRTLLATQIMPRPGMQPVTILPQPTHTMVAMSSMVAVAPQPPLHPPPLAEEPSAKRSKTEDQLMPEEEFFKTFGRGQVTITVQLPIVPEKPEWNLNGQAIPLTMPLTDPISVIKAKLSDLLGGMPAGKQKLVYNDMFVKDSNSLGFYNMMNGSVVYLQLKERGGRKK
ncbi:unnamed protein product [Rotaria socialis]|uniref:Splicing factor 3A subunit 1 n=1 Tax=Rotaria socialis TaxID=392032 RepID=A0A820IBL0_9BILA|nr:unnamed protein product [Rotaria socialis]CAF3312297.1 unnamed protein product [Rotaria socialis]CAF3320893.1 unnamed protein product [Rotaria socialis]CAF3384157.1 unnamed protein product [Rotaria socialis]CAF3611268.1 unnamed protein product [Rotaria socialis]